jgi:hypothetical protein
MVWDVGYSEFVWIVSGKGAVVVMGRRGQREEVERLGCCAVCFVCGEWV